MLAVVVGVALSAVSACSSSAPGAQAPVAATPSPSATAPPSAAPHPASVASSSPAPSPTTPAAPATQVPLAPPKTPETVAGAEQVTRAYFAALNEVNAIGDPERAKQLPGYVLSTCQLCVAFNRNLSAYAVTVTRVHGRPIGGVNTITGLKLDADREHAHNAVGSVRFFTTANALLDAHGKVLAQGPAGPLRTYFLYLFYSHGQWRISGLAAAS